MSGYTNFAVIGAGNFGSFVIRQLLKDRVAGTVKKIVVLTRQVKYLTNNPAVHDFTDKHALCSGIQNHRSGRRQVDYSNDDSIKRALAGVHVVISTIQPRAIDVQTKIAAAAKEAGVRLFCPSEFGRISEDKTEGVFAAKASAQEKLKAMGVPYAAFYNGPFSDMACHTDCGCYKEAGVRSGRHLCAIG